jgi:uncharacterized protein
VWKNVFTHLNVFTHSTVKKYFNLAVTFKKKERLNKMDKNTKLELEAAAFRGLIKHLQKRTDVQNIDIMNLAGFCRNCLSKWYLAAAKDRDIDLNFDQAREIIYGMPYSEWKDKHQNEASANQQDLYKKTQALHAKITGYD